MSGSLARVPARARTPPTAPPSRARLLKADGYIMLSDFGVSEKLESASFKMSGRTGTRAYMYAAPQPCRQPPPCRGRV